MRGLKHLIVNGYRATGVASFTDAWIETIDAKHRYLLRLVASFTDAWIETPSFFALAVKTKSHLLQMRGLKL